MKYLRIILFSVSIFCFSVICASAQNVASLGNTEWAVTATDYYTSVFSSPVTVIYAFGENNKAIVLVSFVYAPAPQTTFDAATGQWKTQYYSPTIQSVSDTNGTFKQNGSSIHIQFSDHHIIATIKGNNMMGEVTDKKSNKKIRWTAERVFGEKNNTPPSKDNSVISLKPKIEEKGFSVSANNQLLGTWKYVEYFERPNFGGSSSLPPMLKYSMTAVFSQDGLLDITTHTFTNLTERTNWRYTPKDDESGTLEQYNNNELLFKGDVRWINKNQFEYTGKFSKNPNVSVNKLIWTRQ